MLEDADSFPDKDIFGFKEKKTKQKEIFDLGFGPNLDFMFTYEDLFLEFNEVLFRYKELNMLLVI